MPRPKKIDKVTDTHFFNDVTPLWVSPGRPPVEVRYHDAISALVEWIGPDWVDNDKTWFFPMRSILVKSCESWAVHDWQSDFEWIEERKADIKHLPELDRAFENFLLVLNKAPFRHKKRLLGLTFLAELDSNSTSGLSNKDGIAAVDRAVEWFSGNLKIKDRAYARYGAIEYDGIPPQLPRREVAIALSLADQITWMRRDGLSEGTLNCPHKPSISKNLPWKVIALFASANSTDGDNELSTSNVQTLVKSLARKVVLVNWNGDKPQNAESKPPENAVA